MEERTVIRLNTGASIRTDRKVTPVSDWISEGKQLYGKDHLDWRFKCPMCGKVYSVRDFITASGNVEDGLVLASQECIGRYKGAGSPGDGSGNPDGCNWCAYGFLGTCGKGRLLQAKDGTVFEVFHFAEEGKT